MVLNIDPKDLHYEYDSRGYMLYYKDKPIGGAGISKNARGHRSNTKLFRDSAEATLQGVLHGRIDRYMLDEILARQNGENTNDN